MGGGGVGHREEILGQVLEALEVGWSGVRLGGRARARGRGRVRARGVGVGLGGSNAQRNQRPMYARAPNRPYPACPSR